ncbi:HpcH/HpaI aldolase/citrate lyase family protein [Saliphagus sp. GCM10025334]
MDHTNSIRQEIESGGVVLGAETATFSPSVVEVYGDVGLDFVWLDFEHAGPSPYDSTVLENLTRAAELAGIELLVRLPTGEPPLIRKVLDAGVRSILIPRVETAEAVRTAVEATRYRYDGGVGDRGVGNSRNSTWGNSAPNQVELEDDSVAIGVMIENETAIENLESILAVPELDFVFVGPADLSVSLGGSWLDPPSELDERIDYVVETATDAGMPVGGVATTVSSAQAAVDRGYQVLLVGGELSSARSVLGEKLASLR